MTKTVGKKEFKMKKFLSYILASFATCFFTPLFFSCQDNKEIFPAESHRINFFGLLTQEDNLTTRALSAENITYEAYPTPIYIREDVTGKEPTTGVYMVKSGYDGRLSGMEGKDDLNWIDSDSGHIFYGWTMPWKEDNQPQSEDYEVVSFLEEEYKKLHLDENDYYNCSVLEKFIGTKEGPVNYRDNGEYVELQFQHLVSKIYIASINLTTNDGSTWQNITGEMTIFGLPNKGYFYRHPVEEGKAPYVKNPKEMGTVNDEDFSDITFTIGRSSAIYLCPKVNFKDLQFKIKLTWPSQQGVEGEYYGDFSSVSFIRHPINDEWDSDKGSEEDKTTLHAGEVLTLNLALRQGNVTGVTASIGKWTDKDVGVSGNYSHPGIYTKAQLEDLFNSGKDPVELYSLYGEDENNKKVFHLYEDLILEYGSLNVPEGYIFDGMGHTITVSNLNSDSYKNMRDVYITDGNTTIYIDSEGNVVGGK